MALFLAKAPLAVPKGIIRLFISQHLITLPPVVGGGVFLHGLHHVLQGWEGRRHRPVVFATAPDSSVLSLQPAFCSPGLQERSLSYSKEQ